MSAIYDFLAITLTAIVLQNAIFTRGLGSSKDTLMLSSVRVILFFGGTLTFVATVSALLSWPICFYLRENQFADQLKLPLLLLLSIPTLLCICVVFSALYLISRSFFPYLHYNIRRIIIPASFNCAVLGSILIGFRNNYSFFIMLGFVLGSGIGYTAALLLLYEGKHRIRLSYVPRAFRGLPVMLLYVGILSLAIYGLIGHQLPT